MALKHNQFYLIVLYAIFITLFSPFSLTHCLIYSFLSTLSTQPVPFLSSVTCNRSRLANAGNSVFLSFFVCLPLPSVPPSKMGESECFNYYNIHAYVSPSLLYLPQKWVKVNVLITTIYMHMYITYLNYLVACVHLVSIILHLVQFRVFFLPCHILLHSVLNACTPSSPYSSTPSLSLTCSASPPLLPYFSSTPAFRLKWATRLGEVWGEKDKESLSPSRNPHREIGQVLGRHG